MDDLPFTLPALRAAYAGGMRPEAVVGEVFRRIAALDDPGIFIDLFDREEVLSAARALGAPDPLRPLWGIPFAIKDNIDAAGHPTSSACPAYAAVAKEDAFVVARLRAAGALLVGKTNLDQFATGLVGVRTPYPVPKNALDPDLVPGGSSSGSAVAVAQGLVSFALGTDTAGSGRVPAALNNIVGLKPSLGALSARGVVPACRTLDTVSILALTVDDAYAVFSAAAAEDGRDAYSRKIIAQPMAPIPPRFRVVVPDTASRRFFGDALQAAAFEADLATLSAVGAEIVPADFAPFYEIADMLYDGAWVAERYTVVEALLAEDPGALYPVTAAIIRKAEAMTAADAFRGLYSLQALKRLTGPVIASGDILAVPSVPTLYTRADLDADPVTPNARLGTYTNFVNLLDLAGLAVPTAPRADGRPGSLTLLAPAGQDGWIAAVARAVERAGPMGATGHKRPAPPPLVARERPGEIALAVCGAHMSGLPLNGELTARGGRFLCAARTAPEYRLFALAGGPPARPGLVRDPAGGAVPLEVWAMPKPALGGFLEGIPAPLGLGRVVLESGKTVTGFLCETAGLSGAEELDPAGGWRGYLEPVE